MLGLPIGPGIYDIANGRAEFADTVRRDPKSDLQLISGDLGRELPGSLDDRSFGSIAHALESAYDHVVYFAGPDEALAVMQQRSIAEPALVLLSDPESGTEETLWQADNIFGDSVEQPPLIIVADLVPRSRLQLPFGIGQRAI